MASGLPYFKWYPSDAECDENFRAMSDAEIGFYIRCLNHSWINGSIPADPAKRAKVLRTRLDVANRMWESVGKMYSPKEQSRTLSDLSSTLDRDHLVNRRQESERESATSRRAKSLFANEVKYSRRSQGVAMESQTPPISESESESDITPIIPSAVASGKKKPGKPKMADALRLLASRTGEDRTSWWEAFWRVYPCHESPTPAALAFEKVVETREQAEVVYRGAVRYAAKIAADPSRIKKYGQGWINDEMWLAEDVTVVVKSSQYVTPGSPEDKCLNDEPY